MNQKHQLPYFSATPPLHLYRLPHLKNLDVIVIQRAPKTVCKKEPEDKDDETDSGSAAAGCK